MTIFNTNIGMIMLKKSWMVGVVVGLLATTSRAQEKIVGVAQRIRIASGVSGHIHPALCITKKGTLIAIYSQSDYKDLKIARSTDGGKTWSKPAPYPHTEKTSFYPGSLTTLSDGRILHAWNVWYTHEKKKSRYVAFSLSDDDGMTWSEPKSLPKNQDMESVVRHPIIELSPKQWLFALTDKTIVYDPTTEQHVLFGDGRTHGLVPIVQTAQGTFVSAAGLRSTDGGKTWAKVSPFPNVADQGWRHEMLALSNGWIVASDIVGPGVGGETISFIVSRDDGATWDVKHPIAYYHPGRPIGGRACPKTVEVDAQTLGTIFYDTDAKQEGGSGVFFLRTQVQRLQGEK